MAAFTGLYIIIAICMGYVVSGYEADINNEYRVEINRIARDVVEQSGDMHKNTTGVHIIDIAEYSYAMHIYNIMYMNSSESSNANTVEKFYQPNNRYQMEIVPVTGNGDVTGFLRFDYSKNISVKNVLCVSEIALFMIYMLAAGILVYTNQRIIKPFNKMSSMAYELSRGNLNEELEESRNRYFGKFLWGLGMLRDTLNTHRQKELKLAKDKKMLVLSISHDIKTPLNAINLYAKALEQGIYPTDEERMDVAIKIQDKASEINEFVGELIKSSTEEVVTIDVRDSEYYLKELMKKVYSGFGEKCAIRNIMFEIGSYENLLLRGDIDRMYEAIGNLIENAVKYGDGKRIEITFSEEEGYELIHVKNTGEPVSDMESNHLFESFFRGGNAENKKGNGLGLYICRQIMRKMNGDIYATVLDDGMEFILVCRIC